MPKCQEEFQVRRNGARPLARLRVFLPPPTSPFGRGSGCELAPLLDSLGSWLDDPNSENMDEAVIIPGPIMSLRLMLDVALGTEGESRKYFEEFIKITHRARREPRANHD